VLASKGLPASVAILAGLIDGEDGSRYGVVLTPGQECIVFELAPDSTLIRWDAISDPRVLADSFDAVITGIAMLRDGQIS
jgi:hypothetical protein